MTAPSRSHPQTAQRIAVSGRSTSAPASTAPASPLLHYHRAGAVGSSSEDVRTPDDGLAGAVCDSDLGAGLRRSACLPAGVLGTAGVLWHRTTPQ
jgi:hypothetical protein